MLHVGAPALGGGIEAKSGNVYLVEERRPKTSYDLLESALSAGYAGMVFTRDFPKRLLEERNLGNCKVLWMTNLVGEGRVNPTAVGIMMGHLRSFIEANPKSVIVIDGLEYLISLNTYDRMLQFMHQARDVVVTNDSIMLVPLDPRTLSQRELAMLERSMELISSKSEEVPDAAILGEGEDGELKLLDVGNRHM